MTRRYQPGYPPVNLEPNVRAWLAEELRRIANAVDPLSAVPVLDVEPDKPTKGLLVWAVGSNWDPGAGEGLYVYNQSGTWDKVN